MTDKSEIRLGIVGMQLGLWHAGAIAEIDGASIVAVADNIPGKLPGPDITLREWADSLGADAYTDGVEMIRNADIDAVDLCVSPRWRLPLVEAAAERGLPVLLEKPWGANMAHGRALADDLAGARGNSTAGSGGLADRPHAAAPGTARGGDPWVSRRAALWAESLS